MTQLISLSELIRSFFSLWAFLICLTFIFSVIHSANQKRISFAVFSLFPFAVSFFLWQVLFDIHLFGDTENASDISRRLGGVPWLCWMAVLLILSISAGWILISVIRYGRETVTPTSVKLYLDQMPCGICCWLDSGRVLFSNTCMNELYSAVTGRSLQNGFQLYDAVSDGIVTAGERVWRFNCRDITYEGEKMHEMIASDITAEYAKTEALKRDKEELSRLNRELRKYTLGIDDTVRKQEILQAKVSIHDEMNRLMLSTMAAENDDSENRDRIFSLWERNALLLCMEANEKTETKAAAKTEKLAKALRIDLLWESDLPTALTEKQQTLFFSAAQEAVINASKHAEAKTLRISFTETETGVCCHFINDGNIPRGEVSFTGGLVNLSELAGNQGASVFAKAGDVFTLTLCFPKKA